MKLKTSNAPHIRHHENTRVLMVNSILAMLFLYGMAYYYYGPRSVALGCVSVLSAFLFDIVANLISSRQINPRDFSAVVTGMLIPLLMPASMQYRVVVVAAAFAILVVKHPFGGAGHNIFNPAAAGYAFALISFREQMFQYPQPLTWLPLSGPIETTLVNSPSFTLSLGGIPKYDLVDMLLGNYPGPMGATNILVILACLLYLGLRNTVRWEVPACFFTMAAAMAFLFPRGGIELGLDWIMRLRLTGYEMMSGVLVLGGVFMLGDPVTTPSRDVSKTMFAIVAGVVVMLFRHYGNFEETMPFAVLCMNATVWGFDMLGERIAHRRRQKRTPVVQ